MRLVIEDEEGRRHIVPFASDEVTVGRGERGNTVALDERNVSRRHARFVRVNGAIFVEDLGSANGTHVNGERLDGRRRVREGDLVEIGDYDLALLEGAERDATARPPPLPPTSDEIVPAETPSTGAIPIADATPVDASPIAVPPVALAAPAPDARRGGARAVLLGAALFLAAAALGLAAGLLRRAL